MASVDLCHVIHLVTWAFHFVIITFGEAFPPNFKYSTQLKQRKYHLHKT